MKRRILLITAIILVFIAVVNPVIVSMQVIFPMKLNEIKWIEVASETKNPEVYYVLTEEENEKFVELMNNIELISGEEAKGTMAYEIVDDFCIDAYEKEVQQYVRVWYKTSLLQKKVGIQLWFYEDNSFLLSEILNTHQAPFWFAWDLITDETVYEHGYEVFTDADADKAECAALIQWINEYKVMREARK